MSKHEGSIWSLVALATLGCNTQETIAPESSEERAETAGHS